MSWKRSSRPRAEAGARGGFYLPVRLPHEVAPLFRAWLDEHYPDRARQGDGDDPVAPRRPRQRSQFLQPDARARARGPTCSAPGSRSRRKKYGLPQAKFALRRDLFEPPQGDQMRLL